MIDFSLPRILPLRIAMALVLALGLFLSGMSAAIAQSQNCTQITAILRGIERNEIYASFTGIERELQARQAEVSRAESQWVQGGCQQSLNSGQALTRQCQSIAQIITLGRDQIEQLSAMASEGQTLAQNRERLLADYARLNCDAGGGSANQDPRGSLLNNMFGGGYDYVERPYDPWASQQTRRTVCVRTCDGFYWPISFSTTDGYIGQDAIQCHEMCPGTEVALFSYRNPGEDPEDMISLSGQSYRSMPYAFRFREEIDTECSCQTREPVGTIAINPVGTSGSAVLDLGESSVPLPRRDPRAPVDAVVAEAVYVPLPRPRPGTEAENSDGSAQTAEAGNNDMRIVDFGEKNVRIVGPETPFVPEPAEEP